MKSLKLITLLFLFSVTISFGQGWHYQIDNSFNPITFVTATNKTADGNYIVFNQDKILEFDEYGEPVFTYRNPSFSTSSTSYPNRTYIQKGVDGYIVAYINADGGSGPLLLGKLGLDGNWIWEKTLNRPSENLNRQSTPSCVITPDNKLFMAAVDSAYLINPDNGQVLWRKFLFDDNFVSTTMSDNELLAITEYGEFFILDAAGTTLNTHSLNFFSTRILDTDNHYIIVGGDAGTTKLVFFDKTNNTSNSLSFGNGILYDVKETHDGFILAGGDGQQAFLIKTNELGVQEWQQFYGDGTVQNVEVSSSGGYVITINDNPNPLSVLKTDGDGNILQGDPERIFGNFRSIDVSNIQTMFSADGTMFWDYQRGQFQAPKGSGVSSIFAGGLWLGGISNNDNQFKVAAETYQNSNSKDFWAGPTGVDHDLSELWNKVWKIKRNELRDFQNDIADGTLSRPIPNDILTWPAIGNPHFKGKIDLLLTINSPLADFVDVNSDGIYNAYDGDYPVIKGDEMLWWVYNDSTGIHTETGADPIGATIIGKAYGYDCQGNDDIYNTLFIEFDIKNDGTSTINDFLIGSWTDFDLGCYLDDLIGSDTISDAFYVYNQNVIDGQNGCNNTPSYGSNPPIQSVSFLNQDLNSFAYYVNGGFPGLPSTGDPAVGAQYYNVLNGNWRDGTPTTIGGNGYQQGSTITKYAFSGNPSTTDWSLCSANLPGADFRSVGSVGPFTFTPGQTISVQMAYTLHENIPLPCPDISTNVRTNIANVKTAVNSQTLDWIPNLGEDRTIDLNSSITLNPNYSGSTYQWSNNTTGTTLDITAPGVYSVTITDGNGCQKTDDVNIYAYTDVEEIQRIVDFKAFPNPTSDKINVSFETTINQNTEITFSLVNLIGQTIKTQKVNANQKQMSFDVSELPTGIYFLSAMSNTEIVQTKKIVIER